VAVAISINRFETNHLYRLSRLGLRLIPHKFTHDALACGKCLTLTTEGTMLRQFYEAISAHWVDRKLR